MNKSDYEKENGLGLAHLLWSDAVSPLELMRCAIALAEERNPALNALCYPRYDEALARAATLTRKGTFGALPFLLKDTGLGSKFLPWSSGSRLFAGSTSNIESTLNSRFLEAGLFAFARTTVPEFSMAPTTEALQNGGPTRNPWDRSRSAGGSSGGAAAAVAAGIVPIAHGSDGGGSIRIPAACCGLYGLRPSRGLMPVGPLRGEGWGGLSVEGVLSRSVRDTAAVLDATAGMELGAPYASPAKPDSYGALLSRPFERPLRIAIWRSAWDEIAIAPDCLAAVDQAERLLTRLGHELVPERPPPLKFASFIEAMITVLASNVTLTVNGRLRQDRVPDWQEKLEPAILDAYHIGMALSAETYSLAINRFHSIGRLLATYMAEYDLILTPTLTEPPALLGRFSTDDDFRSFRRKVAKYTAFLAVINASGQPAANLPLYWSNEGLPIGVQLVGRFGAEADLLRISAHLEADTGWTRRRPPALEGTGPAS
jgi:amidase